MSTRTLVFIVLSFIIVSYAFSQTSFYSEKHNRTITAWPPTHIENFYLDLGVDEYETVLVLSEGENFILTDIYSSATGGNIKLRILRNSLDQLRLTHLHGDGDGYLCNFNSGIPFTSGDSLIVHHNEGGNELYVTLSGYFF